eukprot:scaffold73_cov337-Pavlova_lutheri.AAC.28
MVILGGLEKALAHATLSTFQRNHSFYGHEDDGEILSCSNAFGDGSVQARASLHMVIPTAPLLIVPHGVCNLGLVGWKGRSCVGLAFGVHGTGP